MFRSLKDVYAEYRSIMKKIVVDILPATSIIVISMYLNSILIFQQNIGIVYQKGRVFHKGF